MRKVVLLTFVAVVHFGACSQEIKPEKDQPLAALMEKVREKQETTKVGADIAVGLGLQNPHAEIPAYGQLWSDGKEHHMIMVTDANDVIVSFGTSSVAYFCLTDVSGKLRRVFGAEPGNEEINVSVSDVVPRFEEEIAFWKTYLGVPG
jgi:hypothetical protein